MNVGWNLISLNIIPFNNSFAYVKQLLGNKFIIAKSADGKIYSPPFANNLNTWDNQKAYVIKLTDTASLNISGLAISPENYPINFENTGWYWLPYLRNSNISPALGLVSIIGSYDHVKDLDGKVFKINSTNTLQNLSPGKGYLIYITNTATSLIYPPN